MIADLVMNHTSSDHPWFQEARSDPRLAEARLVRLVGHRRRATRTRGSSSSTPSRRTGRGTRCAGQYYWHRFFSHQPDLNYDNPEVQDAMLDVLRFWLDLGLDGFRLDAVPYLFERDGTNCENLPETHEYLKRVRAEVDASYPDRVLLAEANQWPADVVDYFGDGDECHMAFHFPVMPRLFMAIRREDATPIVEILEQTPPIPDNCQWGLFLRNHDELTLEMVTDEERDYMYAEYAKDPRMKLNLGIRRRLAPLLDNGRDEIELLTAILFSLPGSPVLYYGDEIGMGDNIYLGDRDGVRTPMQWTGDRNGGFSRADFAQLYLPPLMDPGLRLPGGQRRGAAAHADVAAALAAPLHRAAQGAPRLRARQLRGAAARRTTRILAHIRRYEDDDRALRPQPGALGAGRSSSTCRAFEGLVPEEMFGRTRFPRDRRAAVPAHARGPRLLLVPARGGRRVSRQPGRLASSSRGRAARRSCASSAGSARSRARSIGVADRRQRGAARATRRALADALVEIRFGSGDARRLPAARSAADGRRRPVIAATTAAPSTRRRRRRVRARAGRPDRAAATMLDGGDGTLEFCGAGAAARRRPTIRDVRPLGVEQSNTSVVFDDELIVKVYRRLEAGREPRARAAALLRPSTASRTCRSSWGWWSYAGPLMQRVARDRAAVRRRRASTAGRSRSRSCRRDPEAFLGRVRAARRGDRRDARRARLRARRPGVRARGARARSRSRSSRRRSTRRSTRSSCTLPDDDAVAPIAGRGEACATLLRELSTVGSVGQRIRHHGDLHLGQVLWTDGDWLVIDFEGEPARPLPERRLKHSPLRDVAGMLRSFAYAVARRRRRRTASVEAARARRVPRRLPRRGRSAPTCCRRARRPSGCCAIFELEKAVYELRYELANRPDWVSRPRRGDRAPARAEQMT